MAKMKKLKKLDAGEQKAINGGSVGVTKKLYYRKGKPYYKNIYQVCVGEGANMKLVTLRNLEEAIAVDRAANREENDLFNNGRVKIIWIEPGGEKTIEYVD